MQPHMNPYDFLEKQSQSPRFGGASKKSLALFFGGIVLLLVIIIIVVASLLRGGESAELTLRTVAIRQNEITSLTDINEVRENTSGDVKAAVATISLSAKSDKARLIAAVGERGIEWKEDQLTSGNVAANQTQIETAAAAGTLDETVLTLLAAELSSYRSELSSAFEQTSSPELQQLLQESFTNTDLLVKQLEAAR